jgi:hypothetical protein
MGVNLFYFGGYLAFALPFLTIAAILVHYHLRRAIWKFKRRRGMKNPGFCPSSAALGMVLLFAQMLYGPSVSHAIEARQQEDADEDDEDDPEAPEKHLLRQLRRIRRGEQVDPLVLRLRSNRSRDVNAADLSQELGKSA